MAYFTIEGYNSYSGCDISVTATLPMINGQQMNKYYSLGSLQTLSISTHQDKRPVRSLGVINAKDYVMGPRTIAGSMVFAVFNKHFASEIMADLGASGSDVILPDEIPALNITVNFANEYGRMSRMAIYGVKIINEGQVMSINDLYTENTYQFVALGLEPLNTEINESKSTTTKRTIVSIKPREIAFKDISIDIDPTTRKILSRDKGPLPQYDDEYPTKLWDDNSGKNIKDEITNYRPIGTLPGGVNNTFNIGDKIILQVKTERPINENDLGVATFRLTPDQTVGIIHIANLDPERNNNIVGDGDVNIGDNDDDDMDAGDITFNDLIGITNGTSSIRKYSYSINIADKVIYAIALPPGEYIAQFVSPSNEYSNIVNFTTEDYVSYDYIPAKEIYPFIDKVTDENILVSNGDYTHNSLYYFENGGLLNHIDVGKKAINLSNLKSNIDYIMYTTLNSSTFNKSREAIKQLARSELVKVKTHKTNYEPLNIFIDFIKTNKNLLINPMEEMVSLISNLNYDKYYTLIDLVLSLPESLAKQELLIYANILTRQLITSYNISNKYHIVDVIQKTPFEPAITLTSYNKASFNSYNNQKISLEKSINPMQEVFYAKPNKHYHVQCIDDGIKTVKQDFAICRPSVYEDLYNYCDVDNYQKLNYDSYMNIYNKYSYATIEAIAIRDNCHSDFAALLPPYIYEDEEDGHIHADVKYLNLKQDTTYYLAVSELYDALDYKPCRKVPFTIDTNDIDLYYHYLGMIPSKKYLFWIETEEFIKISKPYLFIYNENSSKAQVESIRRDELHSYLARVKKEFIDLDGTKNKTIITDLINYVSSMDPMDKNINMILHNEFINTFTESLYISDVFYSFFELNLITHNIDNINLNAKILINTNNRVIQLKTSQEFYICGISYNNNDVYRLTDIKNQIFYEDDGYTIIYLMNNHLFYQTGFILIDNKTGKYLCTDDMVKYIEKVE